MRYELPYSNRLREMGCIVKSGGVNLATCVLENGRGAIHVLIE